MALWLVVVIAALVLAVIGVGTAAWWLIGAGLVLLVVGVASASISRRRV